MSMLSWTLRFIQNTDIYGGSRGSWLLACKSVVARILRSSDGMDIHGEISPAFDTYSPVQTYPCLFEIHVIMDISGDVDTVFLEEL